jgi:hypothetical protein
LPKQQKRKGRLMNSEIAVIEAALADSPTEASPALVQGLSMTLKRSKQAVKDAIDRARIKFAQQAEHYTEVHKQVVDTALLDGSAKALEQARLGAEWAMENISIEGTRIVDKPSKDVNTGLKVMVGVKIGGMKDGITVETTGDVD